VVDKERERARHRYSPHSSTLCVSLSRLHHLPKLFQLLDTGRDPAERVEQGDDLVAGKPGNKYCQMSKQIHLLLIPVADKLNTTARSFISQNVPS
jgi:hypothetical protein